MNQPDVRPNLLRAEAEERRIADAARGELLAAATQLSPKIRQLIDLAAGLIAGITMLEREVRMHNRRNPMRTPWTHRIGVEIDHLRQAQRLAVMVGELAEAAELLAGIVDHKDIGRTIWSASDAVREALAVAWLPNGPNDQGEADE